MRLDRMTWPEAEAAIARLPLVILATGSTEQHGPMGLIGTDALCAEAVAERTAERLGAIMAPPLPYTPAPFNMGFPGTLSVSPGTFIATVAEIVAGLARHGVRAAYVVNGHGANLAPLSEVAEAAPIAVRVKSWWAYPEVNRLRQSFYGDWEGMHATPSEVAMTQALLRRVAPGAAAGPPKALPDGYIAARSGDRHGPPDGHRAAFPDGRVGSHSALADPDHGRALLAAAVRGALADVSDLAGTLGLAVAPCDQSPGRAPVA